MCHFRKIINFKKPNAKDASAMCCSSMINNNTINEFLKITYKNVSTIYYLSYS